MKLMYVILFQRDFRKSHLLKLLLSPCGNQKEHKCDCEQESAVR